MGEESAVADEGSGRRVHTADTDGSAVETELELEDADAVGEEGKRRERRNWRRTRRADGKEEGEENLYSSDRGVISFSVLPSNSNGFGVVDEEE